MKAYSPVEYRAAVLMEVFSTIRSPVFSEFAIYTGYEVGDLPKEVTLFETLRKMSEVKRFKLVFLLEVWDLWDPRQELAEALDVVAAKGFLEFLDSPPTIRTAPCFVHAWDFLDFD